MSLIELTCPFETFSDRPSCQAANERKRGKYQIFIDEVSKHVKVTLYCVEVGSRGYVASSMLSIKHLLGLDKKDLRKFLVKLGQTAFLQSVRILNHRDHVERDDPLDL